MRTTDRVDIFQPRFRAPFASRAWTFFLVTGISFVARADDLPKAPVPKSPFIAVVYAYADAMLDNGRDAFGPQKTGLFLSALDRAALAPLTDHPPAPAGVHEAERAGAKERALTGAHPQHDENLLRLLYLLSELSGKPKYRDAADTELKWFMENAASPATRRLSPGGAMLWDVVQDEPILRDDAPARAQLFFRPWLLWDRCFEVAPQATAQLALDLSEHHAAIHAGGAAGTNADFAKGAVESARDFPRHAGFCIRTMAVAYARTKDAQFLPAIERLLEELERNSQPRAGATEAKTATMSTASILSLAIDCEGAAHRLPRPLASRLRALADRQDAIFCALPHDAKAAGGFIAEFQAGTGTVTGQPTALWSAQHGLSTTAQIGMMCVSRYENTGKPGYRHLIHAAADAYLKSSPGEAEEVWPRTVGHAISLQLAAWRSTAKQVYFDRARGLGDFALEKLFDHGPLPRAGLHCDHYETVTGADTLALALAELHLEILDITAVRCPPNTIDR